MVCSSGLGGRREVTDDSAVVETEEVSYGSRWIALGGFCLAKLEAMDVAMARLAHVGCWLLVVWIV